MIQIVHAQFIVIYIEFVHYDLSIMSSIDDD